MTDDRGTGREEKKRGRTVKNRPSSRSHMGFTITSSAVCGLQRREVKIGSRSLYLCNYDGAQSGNKWRSISGGWRCIAFLHLLFCYGCFGYSSPLQRWCMEYCTFKLTRSYLELHSCYLNLDTVKWRRIIERGLHLVRMILMR